MAVVIRWVSAILAVLMGLPLLLSSVFQSLLKVGYDEKPTQAISENFLEGNVDFIDEAVADSWSAGYAKRLLTPDDISSHRYFLGGFLKFPAQEVTGVIDDLYVRAVVLDDNSGRGAAAFAWIDGIGFMNADVKAVREKLSDITGEGKLISIDIGSTHTHSAVDTQGLWGNIPKSGRDEAYIDALVSKAADAIREAYNTRTNGQLYYASEYCPVMFNDSRNPRAVDEYIHLFRFKPDDGEKKEIYISNFGAHPVNLAWSNSELSGDYPYYVEQAVNTKCNADFIFIQGAIGGGVGCNLTEENGIPQIGDSNYERMQAYSLKVADILAALAEKSERVDPILNVAHAQLDFVVDNFVFKLAERAGLCNATAFKENGDIKLTSEIGYIEIGKNVKILEAPGEVLPEIVYGGFYSAQEAFNGCEYPYEPLKNKFAAEDEILVFGLCNDAVGYIVPDNDYSASNEEGHYEETVSTGSTAASSLSKAFDKLITERCD